MAAPQAQHRWLDDGRGRRFHPPRCPASDLPRPALLARLRRGLDRQFALLSGAPGVGRTSLLVEAYESVRREGTKAAWLSLDAGDADPLRIARLLVEAVGRSGAPLPGAARCLSRMTAGDEPDRAAVELAGVLSRCPDRLVLFLDDLHKVRCAAVARFLEALLEDLPEHVAVAAAGRGRLPVRMSQLRVRGLSEELGGRDLCFSEEEVARLAGSRLPPRDAEAFARATGGWPALVQLGLGALARDRSRGLLLDTVLSGADPLLADFVRDEVLPCLPAPVRRTALVCAVLDRFPAGLVSELDGSAVDGEAMRELYDLSPLVTVSGEAPGWIGFHPVVGRALLVEARARAVDASDLHARAAAWLASRGHVEEAVRHAGQAGDFALAAEAIRRSGGVQLFIRSGYRFLERLLEELPPRVVHGSATLHLSQALVIAKRGRLEAAREIVDELKRRLRPEAPTAAQDPVIASDLEHIDSLLAIYEDRNLGEACIRELEARARDVPPGDTWRLGWIYNHLCIACVREGHLSAARRAALRAIDYYHEEQATYALVFMYVHLGLINATEGRLSAALAQYDAAERLAREAQPGDETLQAIVQAAGAEALYARDALPAAADRLDFALPRLAKGDGWVDLLARAFGVRAKLGFAREGLGGGLVAADAAASVAAERALPRLGMVADLIRAELMARAGQTEGADLVLRDGRPADAGGAPRWPATDLTWRERFQAQVIRARVLAQQGADREALALAAVAGRGARPRGARGRARRRHRPLHAAVALREGRGGHRRPRGGGRLRGSRRDSPPLRG